MTATIDIYGPTSTLKGDFDLDAVRAATSWRVEGAEYSKAYRRGAWDGRKHLFHAKTGAFPTGLVKVVEGVLRATSVAYVTTDHREDPYSGEPEENQDNSQGLQHQKVGTFSLQGAPFVGKYSYQLDACRDMVAAKQGIVRVATNGGKTEIACGVTNYLDIRTLFIVTSKELLYQARARFATRLGLPLEEIGLIGDGHWQPGEWVTISTLDTLESRLDTPECQSFLKKQELLFVDECVDPESVITTESGYKLAKNIVPGDVLITKDGSNTVTHKAITHGPGVTVTTQYGVPLTVSANHPVAVFDENGGISFVHACMLTTSDVLVEYRDPKVSTDDPVAYLVGLFAGDGCWHTPKAVRWAFRKDEDWWLTEIQVLLESTFPDALCRVSTNKRGDVTLTVRSELFLRVLSSEGFKPQQRKTGCLPVPKRAHASYIGGLFDAKGDCDSQGRVNINTTDKSLMYFVTTKLRELDIEASYQEIVRTNPKHSNLHRVTVPARQAQEFHAVCKTRMPRKQKTCGASRQYVNKGVRELCRRAGTQKKAPTLQHDYLPHAAHTAFKPVAIRSISTVPDHAFITLEVEKSHTYIAQNLLQHNCHHVGSETWYTVATLCGAYYRFGLSGTPLDRTDGANLRLRAATGDVIVDIGNEFLVNLGVSAKAHIIFDKVSSPQLKKGSRYNTVYKQGVVENDEMTQKIIQWTQLCHAQGLSTLILIDEIPHGRSIDEKLWTDTDEGIFIPHQFIYGEESTEVRANALREFGERKLPVLIASTILDEGVDVPTIDVVICAGSRKSKIRTLQRLGRGLRGERLIVIEFSNFCHQYLLEHSLHRYRDYKAEKCFPLFQSAPDEGLIKKLWEAQA